MVTLALDRVQVDLGRRCVVDGVSAVLDGGALVGILGPNGAGKSTLVRSIVGTVPHGGTVTLDGTAVSALPRAERARRIAYLPQGPDIHWPVAVERLVALGRLPYLTPMSRLAPGDAAAVTRAMERADVAPLAARVATDLSGGERARVLLARALAVAAPVLVVDEPLASLDPAHQIEVMELLREEARGGGLVIAVLHDLTLAARYCDRVLVMDRGRLVADGPPAAVLDEDLLATTYGIRVWSSPERPGLIVPLERLR